jgi:hypothetical protein
MDVIGTISGERSPVLHYFADVLHGDGTSLPAFTTRVLDIRLWPSEAKRPIRGRMLSPLNVIAMLSCAMSIGISAWAIALGDGAGLTGVLIMSFTTPILCVGLNWKLQYRKYQFRDKTKDCIVFRIAQGQFTVVRCEEDIGRLLMGIGEKVGELS